MATYFTYQVENVVSFVVTETTTGNENEQYSVGRNLSSLCIKHAPIGQGFLYWAEERGKQSEFAKSAVYPTLAPGILSLSRIIAKYHPFSREKVMRIAFLFLKHSPSSEISHQKLSALKKQCLRLLLFLSARGHLSIEVFNNIHQRLNLGGSCEIDSELLRYFIAGALQIVCTPISASFVRAMGSVLATENCSTALNSKFFETSNRMALKKLIINFQEVVSDESKFSKVASRDKSLVSSLASMYGISTVTK